MVAMCTIMAVILRGRKVRNMKDWVYSKNPVALDILVNTIIVAATMVVLLCTVTEQPDSDFPIRVWLGWYLVHCLVNVVFVWFEYRRLARRRTRRRRREAGLDADAVGNGNGNGNGNDNGNGYGSVGGDGDSIVVAYSGSWKRGSLGISYAYKCDVLNLWASLVWEIVGLCWLPLQSPDKLFWQNAPCLYRLTMICLTYDGMFTMLCLVGIVVCFSLSRIIAILYTAAGQKQQDASEANLNVLQKHRFHLSSNGEKPSVGAGMMVPMDTVSGDTGTDCNLLPAGAECCICLCSYDDGIELHALPCNHRFHAKCIEQWLNINATCPVCNYDILKGSA